MSQTKSLIKEPLTEVERIIAEHLSKVCGIPGCMAAVHKDDADLLVRQLNEKGYRISKKAGE